MKHPHVRWNDTDYVLIGDLDGGGAITTPERFSAGIVSIAHLMPDGRIMQHGQRVGSRDDVTVLEKVEVPVEDVVTSITTMVSGRGGWLTFVLLILLTGIANAQNVQSRFGPNPYQHQPYQAYQQPNSIPNYPGIRPLPIIPPIGATNCQQQVICDQFNHCHWQNVCR